MLSQLNAEIARHHTAEIAATAELRHRHELPARSRLVADAHRPSRVRATFVRLRIARPVVRPA